MKRPTVERPRMFTRRCRCGKTYSGGAKAAGCPTCRRERAERLAEMHRNGTGARDQGHRLLKPHDVGMLGMEGRPAQGEVLIRDERERVVEARRLALRYRAETDPRRWSRW